MYKPILAAARLSAAAGLLSLSLQAAPVVIDDFSTSYGPVTANTTQDGTMIGGERDIVFGPVDASVTVSGGSLAISNVTNPGSISFMYDGEDNTPTGNNFGLGGINLVTGANPQFELIVSQITGSVSFGLTVFESATEYSTIGGTFTSVGAYYFSFASMTDAAGGGADLTSIEQLRMNLTTFADTSSITIDSFRAVGDPTSDVPEPATWLLMLTGIGALATKRRRS